METKANYTLVGAVVLALSTALLCLSIWLSSEFNDADYDTYVVYMHEAVSGLSRDAPVKYNGVKVGFVRDIELNHDNPQQVRLLLSIAQGTPITVSTTATLIAQGITGTTYLGLSAKSADLTPLRAAKGELYPIIPATPSVFNQLDDVLKKVSDDIGQVFDPENRDNLKSTLKNLRTFTEGLADDRNQLHTLIVHLNQSLTELPETIHHFNMSVQNISQITIPSANQLLRHLNGMAVNLEKASHEVRNNPAVIIRGHTPPKPGPGES